MSVNSVSKVGKIDFGAGLVQVEAPRPAEASEHGESVDLSKPSEQTKAAEQTASAPVLNGDVRLKFIVDAKTNDVTVLVLDKTSRQIIRTIPTDELKNLTRGELVTIFA